jgi:hypothetical protein
MASANVLAIEVEAGENPSRLAAPTYAASGSRIRQQLSPLILNLLNTVAIGRGPLRPQMNHVAEANLNAASARIGASAFGANRKPSAQ